MRERCESDRRKGERGNGGINELERKEVCNECGEG